MVGGSKNSVFKSTVGTEREKRREEICRFTIQDDSYVDLIGPFNNLYV